MADLLRDLFYYSPDKIYTHEHFNTMWEYDKQKLLETICFLRSPRKLGRGEKNIYHQFLVWLSYNHITELVQVIEYIPNIGYWKDLLVLMGTPAEGLAIALLATQLMRDHYNLNFGNPMISLAAKWAPNEKSAIDRDYGVYGKIATFLGVTRKQLRTEFLVPLRRQLEITEQIISDKKWNTIDYHKVPKLAMQRYRKKFQRRDFTRFTNYQLSTFSPNKSHSLHKIDSKLNFSDTIIAIDISGSMAGLPRDISSSLWTTTHKWIPFDLYAENNNSPIVFLQDPSSYRGYGFSLSDCLQVSNVNHIIIISTHILLESEIPFLEKTHITYWCIENRFPLIYDYPNLTLIRGYHKSIFYALQNKQIISREIFCKNSLSTFASQTSLPALK